MVPVECIIAFAMGLVEIIRKSKPEIKSYSPLIALGVALVLSLVNAFLGKQDIGTALVDSFMKTCIAVGLFSGGTAIGSQINPTKPNNP